jgi:hypothetical protein
MFKGSKHFFKEDTMKQSANFISAELCIILNFVLQEVFKRNVENGKCRRLESFNFMFVGAFGTYISFIGKQQRKHEYGDSCNAVS